MNGAVGLDQILRSAVARGASDIHLKSGDVVRLRIDGVLVPLADAACGDADIEAVAVRIAGEQRLHEAMVEGREYDGSYGVPGIGRFRVSLLRQRGAPMLVLRAIPVEIPDFRTLRLPAVVERLAQLERGMIVVTGVTGSGKSSTQAAMIEFMNKRAARHVITLENPIEFLFTDKLASITQREVGADTESFAAGLRSALRQDPDVILIGEMRDAETMDIALKAAETGHLVLSTLHTPDAVTTIHRMLAAFPSPEQRSVRVRLAESLKAVISQRLLPSASGRGRVLACEIMIQTGAVREKILEERPLEEIRELMQEGLAQYGSQTFDQHLEELVREGLVNFETALVAASSPSDFRLRFKIDPRGETARPEPFLDSFVNARSTAG